MPTVFKHELVQDIGIVPIDALTVGAGVRATVIGCNLANTSDYVINTYNRNAFVAGYGNTTSAINAVQFKFSSGNIDDGTILMFGIK